MFDDARLSSFRLSCVYSQQLISWSESVWAASAIRELHPHSFLSSPWTPPSRKTEHSRAMPQNAINEKLFAFLNLDKHLSQLSYIPFHKINGLKQLYLMVSVIKCRGSDFDWFKLLLRTLYEKSLRYLHGIGFVLSEHELINLVVSLTSSCSLVL